MKLVGSSRRGQAGTPAGPSTMAKTKSQGLADACAMKRRGQEGGKRPDTNQPQPDPERTPAGSRHIPTLKMLK